MPLRAPLIWAVVAPGRRILAARAVERGGVGDERSSSDDTLRYRGRWTPCSTPARCTERPGTPRGGRARCRARTRSQARRECREGPTAAAQGSKGSGETEPATAATTPTPRRPSAAADERRWDSDKPRGGRMGERKSRPGSRGGHHRSCGCSESSRPGRSPAVGAGEGPCHVETLPPSDSESSPARSDSVMAKTNRHWRRRSVPPLPPPCSANLPPVVRPSLRGGGGRSGRRV